MCVLLFSTRHPLYPIILLNNRDEYLNRPTARADWWKAPNNHVLGGRDLQRAVQGTWLGITKHGKIAVLTNFREEGAELIEGARSRGEMPNAFLTVPTTDRETPEEFAQRLIEVEGVHGVGGFSLAFGHMQKAPLVGEDEQGPLAFVSNRTPSVKGMEYSQLGTWGLSNSHYGDRAWPKVIDGERLLNELVERNAHKQQSLDDLIGECFQILSIDTLPTKKQGEDFQVFVRELRKSIFIPAIGDEAEEREKPADAIAAAQEKTPLKTAGGIYGTQKQTVILINHQGNVTFVERTIYDQDGKPVAKDDRDRRFEFDIQGWKG